MSRIRGFAQSKVSHQWVTNADPGEFDTRRRAPTKLPLPNPDPRGLTTAFDFAQDDKTLSCFVRFGFYRIYFFVLLYTQRKPYSRMVEPSASIL